MTQDKNIGDEKEIIVDKNEKLEEGEIINTPKTPGFSHPDAMQFEDTKQINQSSPIKEERNEIKAT